MFVRVCCFPPSLSLFYFARAECEQEQQQIKNKATKFGTVIKWAHCNLMWTFILTKKSEKSEHEYKITNGRQGGEEERRQWFVENKTINVQTTYHFINLTEWKYIYTHSMRRKEHAVKLNGMKDKWATKQKKLWTTNVEEREKKYVKIEARVQEIEWVQKWGEV